MKRSNDGCASNRLYRGEVSDFQEAMDCVIAMCHQEKVRGVDGEGESLGDDLNSSLDNYAEAARRCRTEYFQRVRVRLAAIEQELIGALADQWDATDNEDMQRIAACLRSGDYSDLAI